MFPSPSSRYPTKTPRTPRPSTKPLPTKDWRDSTFLDHAMSSEPQAYASAAAATSSWSSDTAYSSSSSGVCVYDTRRWSADGQAWSRHASRAPSQSSSYGQPSRSDTFPPSGLLLDNYPSPSSIGYGYPQAVVEPAMPPAATQLYPLPSPPSSPPALPSHAVHTSIDHQSRASPSAMSLRLHQGLAAHISYNLLHRPLTARFYTATPRRGALHLDTHSYPLERPTLLSPSLSSAPAPIAHSTPATFPPTSSLMLSIGPYTAIPVYPSHPQSGVTFGDIIGALYQFLQQPLSQTELHALAVDRSKVREAYRKRVENEQKQKGTTDWQDSDMLRKVDALLEKTVLLKVVLLAKGKRCIVQTKRPNE